MGCVCVCVLLAAVALIAPLDCAGAYRPYFTIYEGYFQHYLLLSISGVYKGGATNPVLHQVLGDMPTSVVLRHMVALLMPRRAKHDSDGAGYCSRARPRAGCNVCHVLLHRASFCRVILPCSSS